MSDYEGTVPLVVELDRPLAQQVDRFTDKDPEFVRKVLRYGVLRRGVFDVLSSLSPTKALTS